jgi:two-component system phosphate regulon response regulator OmpR
MHAMADSVLLTKAPVHARILVVDDEPLLANALSRALTLTGYEAEAVCSGARALQALQERNYDSLVLDLGLPNEDGIQVMERALQAQPDLLVIILIGQSTLESAIAAVKYHAADYLVKAVSIPQITEAVAQALQRRARQLQERVVLRTLLEAMDILDGDPGAVRPIAPPHVIHVPPLRLDVQTRTVAIGEGPARTSELTRGEVDVLAALMRRPRQPFSVQELASAGLGINASERSVESVVAHHIHRLRGKLEADLEKPRLIRTIRGVGYMFDPDGL